MALSTISIVNKDDAAGDVRFDRLKFNGDGAYPTNGTATFSTIFKTAMGETYGSLTVLGIIPQVTGGYTVEWDRTTDKLKMFYGNTDSADGPNIEVPNTTDLSAVVFELIVISK